MPSCAFNKCTNHSRLKNKTQGITFHAFPQDELWKYKWLVVVRKQRQESDWIPTLHSRVCSSHFQPSDIYMTGKGLKRITKGAVPFFQPKKKTPKQVDSDASPRSSSPNSLKDEDVSDEDSIFDSTQKSYYKAKVHKAENAKQKFLQENSKLRQQNRRLAERCKSLKETLMRVTRKMKLMKKLIVKMGTER